jgi:hypothetical protein
MNVNTRAKFYDLPTEPAPFNRRIYRAAKMPFACLWNILTGLVASLVGIIITLVVLVVRIAVQCIFFFGLCFALLELALYIFK